MNIDRHGFILQLEWVVKAYNSKVAILVPVVWQTCTDDFLFGMPTIPLGVCDYMFVYHTAPAFDCNNISVRIQMASNSKRAIH